MPKKVGIMFVAAISLTLAIVGGYLFINQEFGKHCAVTPEELQRIKEIRMLEYWDEDYILSDEQRQLFIAALARGQMYKPSYAPIPFKIGPDCSIAIIMRDDSQRLFKIYGQATLRDESSGAKWQFDHGINLLQWAKNERRIKGEEKRKK